MQIAESKAGNIDNIATLVGTNYDSLHHFMSDSPWDPKAVMNQVAQLNYGLMREHKEPIVLAIDETSFIKKGKHSAGVSPQYLGSSGKIANGQVVVMSSLVQGTNASLVAAELFIPERWYSEPEMLKKVGINPITQPFKTKIDLALDQIDLLLKLDCMPDYIVADAGYGGSIYFREYCRHLNIKYVLDIKHNSLVWYPGSSATKNERLPASEWKQYAKLGVQKTVLVQSNKAQKPIKRHVTMIPVHVFDEETLARIPQTLMVIEEDKVDVKFKITNEDCIYSNIEPLTKIAAHRYYIERCFQNAKQLFNISGYQVRKYAALMKHLALSMVLGYKYHFELYSAANAEPYLSQNKLLRHFKLLLAAIYESRYSLEESLKVVAEAQERALKNLELAENYWAKTKMPK